MARKMKDSGIEWIGEIPEGWEVLAHKYIMHKEKSICEHYSGEDVISLTLNGVVKRDLENPFGKMPTTFDGYQFVDPNDLLLCLFDIDVTPRCVGLVKDYGVTSPAYSRFKIHSGFCNAYYNYLLRFIDDEKVFVHLSKNLRSSLTESDFGAIKTIVPPKAEQQRIADYLDNRTFEIDTLLSKARSSIEEYKKLKQAVITQAVTKGVRGEREMKDSGVDWIGEIPVDWEISRIKYVSIFEPSCDFRKLTPETIITYSPMECIKNGTFERRTSLYGNLAHTLTPFQNGDIVMAKVTPCFENGNISFGDGQHYEWANGAVNKDGSIIKSGSFKKLFNGCNFPDESRNTWYRQYQYACLTTHASPQGTMGRIALRQSVPCVPIGQTDYGIDIPAKHAARSLALESCAFFSVCPYGNNVIHSIVLNNWADLIDEATDFAVKEGFKDPNKTDLFDSSHNKMN